MCIEEKIFDQLKTDLRQMANVRNAPRPSAKSSHGIALKIFTDPKANVPRLAQKLGDALANEIEQKRRAGKPITGVHALALELRESL